MGVTPDVPAAVRRYLAAARKGADWLRQYQHDDGSIGPPEICADVYHKAGYALAITGHIDAAHRLYDWIVAHDLGPDGRLHHFDQGLALYKTNWICQGAHRLARFELARPVMAYVLTRQAPCGGFFQNDVEERYIEPVCSAWAGVSALYHGHLAVAEKVAECFHAMLAEQPDPRRFYYRMTPAGRLITEGELAAQVDGAQARQAYYCPGIALLFLVRLYLAGADRRHLGIAQRMFEQTLRFNEDAYEYVTAAKGGVACSILYRLTGDSRALAAALRLGDYLAREQRAEGWWCNPYDQGMVVRLDHTAEFVVFLSEIAGNLAGA